MAITWRKFLYIFLTSCYIKFNITVENGGKFQKRGIEPKHRDFTPILTSVNNISIKSLTQKYFLKLELQTIQLLFYICKVNG